MLPIAIFAVNAFMDPVPAALLVGMDEGMTKDEVEQLLGTPSVMYSNHWTYKRPLRFGFVNIHWKADGTYDGQYNYERF